ncbi:MAG: SEC-C domain-containing protein, partial [Chlorobia bacterium]|nr:SEC-C domain-containing protein [Fimbriimonadaceae bacterium]
TVATITFQNLFRLYNKLAGMTGTAKTEEDEFRKIYGLDVVCVPTHRPMTRVDEADIVYKTLEAKFRGMGWEMLRLYSKQQPVLVGTRSIEMTEKVSARLTGEMLQKLVIVQRLRERVEVKKDIKGDLAKDARTIYETDLGELPRGTISAFLPKIDLSADLFGGDWFDWCLNQWKLGTENRQYFEEALKHGIPHNVLNAKFHEREALIIAEAGRKGQITIATNMAGRGVDILLGGRIEDDLVKQARGHIEVAKDGLDEYGDTFASYRRGGKERAAPPLPLDDQERRAAAEEVRVLGGLFILGTERHESRRIDNQLRGRSGRQGDPGESRFFVALEDQLWKIFNANMMENPLLRAWPPMEEVNAGFLSKMIGKTQERIENHFFEARKHVLEYDDVLNAQREHIYGLRREILLGKDVRPDLQKQIKEMMAEVVQNAWMVEDDGSNVYDYQVLYEDLNEIFPLVDYATIGDLEKHEPGQDLVDYVNELAVKAYVVKVEENTDDIMKMIEQQVMLRAVNDHWMSHLQIVEYIRDGIGLRGYGQVDPLVAYKRETYDTFQNTLKNIRDQAVRMIYRAQVQREQEVQADAEPMMMRLEDEYPMEPTPVGGIPGAYPAAMITPTRPGESGAATAIADVSGVDWKRVGRNDACPCGSGKKFKSCHYPQLRAQGVI